MSPARKGAVALALLAAVAVGLMSWESDVLPQARDITQAKLIRTLALDVGEGSALRLTAAGDLRKAGDGGQAQPPLILTQEAMTISAGCSGLQRQSDGFVELGHLAECVIGEELARAGIDGIVDFISRDFSMRLENKIFVVMGGQGAQAVEGASSRNSAATDRLTAISKDQSLGGHRWPYTFRQLVSQLEDNGCALVPALTLTDNPDYDPESGEEPEKELHFTQLAFFREARLVDYLTAEETKGAALLTNEDQADVIEVNLPDGTAVGVQMLYAQRSLQPVFDETGRLTGIRVKISTRGELSEIYGVADPFDEETLEAISQGFREQLRLWVEAALARSRAEGADFLHLRRLLLCACPLEAAELQERWEEDFPALEFQVEIDGRVERSYDTDRSVDEFSQAEGAEGRL